MKHNMLYSVLISLIVAIGGFLLGFDAAVISGAVDFYKTEFALSEGSFMIGFSIASLTVGGIAGNFLAGPLSEKFGRKPVLISTAFLFGYCALATAFADGIVFFIIGRVVGGLGVGLAIITAPMYIAEIAPSKLRGFLVSFNQLNIVLGISIAYFSNYYILQWVEDPTMNWRWMLGVGAIPSVAYFLLLFIVPESPRWLIQRGKDEEGKKIMARVGGQEHSDSEYAKIKESLNKPSESGGSWGELFSKKMRWIMIIGLGLAFFQQASCINSILFYAPVIFKITGFGQNDAFTQAIYLGLVNLVVTLIAMWLIDKAGRKVLLLVGTVIIATSLLTVGFAFNAATYQISGEDIDEMQTEIVERTLTDMAKVENADYYGIDSIAYLDAAGQLTTLGQAEVAVMTKKGKKLTEFEMGSPEILSAQIEAAGIAAILDKYKDDVHDNETELFASIRSDIDAYVKGEVAKVMQDENAIGVSYVFAVNDLKKDVKREGDAKVAVIQEKVSNIKYSFYKDSLIGKSISVNGMLVLIALMGFVAGFGVSLGPVMWTMLSEIFPNKVRAIAISVAGTFNSIVSAGVIAIFPVQLEFQGSASTYITYGLIMVVCIFFVWKFVPETKGQTLEELEGTLIGRH